jgi:HD-like signal output (HDOD) protein
LGRTPSLPTTNPLIVIGDSIKRKPSLDNLFLLIRKANASLPEEQQIKYVVCEHTHDVALSLREYKKNVRLVLLGNDIGGQPAAIARLLSKAAKIIVVTDDSGLPLSDDLGTLAQIKTALEELGIVVERDTQVTEEFYQPIVEQYVMEGLSPLADLANLSPAERAKLVDKRLDSITKFPSLPETQRRVAALEDMDSPKKWAAAIDPDAPTRNSILRSLNSAHYGFRSKIKTIEQSVTMVGATTIREIVLACQIRELFQKVKESRVEQFWAHSIATAYFAKLLMLPTNADAQSHHEKKDLELFGFEDWQSDLLGELRMWERFDLTEKDDPFISGMLHDIGKITMVLCFEDSLAIMDSLVEAEIIDFQAENTNGAVWVKPVRFFEQFLLTDIDHQTIGARIGNFWELEDELLNVISKHHEVTPDSPGLLKLIALADLAANTVAPYPYAPEQHPFPTVLSHVMQATADLEGNELGTTVAEGLTDKVMQGASTVFEEMEVPEALWDVIDQKSFLHLCCAAAPRVGSAAQGFLKQTGQ